MFFDCFARSKQREQGKIDLICVLICGIREQLFFRSQIYLDAHRQNVQHILLSLRPLCEIQLKPKLMKVILSLFLLSIHYPAPSRAWLNRENRGKSVLSVVPDVSILKFSSALSGPAYH